MCAAGIVRDTLCIVWEKYRAFRQ